jgi:predicted component of type VI protein secretion system
VLTRAYLFQPMELELELILKREAIQSVCLGRENWAAAGYTTWLGAEDGAMEDGSVLFPI